MDSLKALDAKRPIRRANKFDAGANGNWLRLEKSTIHRSGHRLDPLLQTHFWDSPAEATRTGVIERSVFERRPMIADSTRQFLFRDPSSGRRVCISNYRL